MATPRPPRPRPEGRIGSQGQPRPNDSGGRTQIGGNGDRAERPRQRSFGVSDQSTRRGSTPNTGQWIDRSAPMSSDVPYRDRPNKSVRSDGRPLTTRASSSRFGPGAGRRAGQQDTSNRRPSDGSGTEQRSDRPGAAGSGRANRFGVRRDDAGQVTGRSGGDRRPYQPGRPAASFTPSSEARGTPRPRHRSLQVRSLPRLPGGEIGGFETARVVFVLCAALRISGFRPCCIGRPGECSEFLSHCDEDGLEEGAFVHNP